MLVYLKSKLNISFEGNNQRSKIVVKNIFLSFGVKGGSIIINLLLVPITINYINPIQYGLWLTLSSIINWLSFFDVGMGNGLRNKLAYNLALNNYQEAKMYVSTTYAVLTLFSIIIITVTSSINPYIDWNMLLNIPRSLKDNVHEIVLIILLSFCAQFVIQLINTILTACHKPALAGLTSLMGQIFILLIIVIFKNILKGDLTKIITILTVSPIITMGIASVYFYNTSLKDISPSFRAVNWKYAKEILKAGSSFFIIQIGALVLFQTSNIIIANKVGVNAVTEYNIAYKLFSLFIMTFSIIITPFWSAFTDAYAKGDKGWMRNSVKKIRILWIFTSLIGIPILILMSDKIYGLWIGNEINISIFLTISVALYAISYTGMSLSCYFLNGIGKVKLQQWIYIGACIVNIPLSVFWGEKMGAAGVVLSNSLTILIITIIVWIQLNKIINNTASGVWAK